jgi:hypothetical protein
MSRTVLCQVTVVVLEIAILMCRHTSKWKTIKQSSAELQVTSLCLSSVCLSSFTILNGLVIDVVVVCNYVKYHGTSLSPNPWYVGLSPPHGRFESRHRCQVPQA